jgi:hypothetical protein
MAAFSAKFARVQLSGVNMVALKWTINAKTDALDVTNFEGSGYAAYIGGILDADISCDCVFDSVQAPFANPPALAPAALLGNGLTGAGSAVKFYLDRTGATYAGFWSFANILIETCNMDTEVRGFVRFTFTARNNGAYLMP